MRYNSESLEIKVAISGNSLLSKDIKISLRLLITVRKIHALFRESLPLQTIEFSNRVSNPKFEANLTA